MIYSVREIVTHAHPRKYSIYFPTPTLLHLNRSSQTPTPQKKAPQSEAFFFARIAGHTQALPRGSRADTQN